MLVFESMKVFFVLCGMGYAFEVTGGALAVARTLV
jgi:hypothetical protein